MTLSRSAVSCLITASYITDEETTIEGQILSETELYFLISKSILASSKWEVCRAMNMIIHDWSYRFPRLEGLLNHQILSHHVTESDSVHLRKIATSKCLFFWLEHLTYFYLPKEVRDVLIRMSWDHLRNGSFSFFKPPQNKALPPTGLRPGLETSHSPSLQCLHTWLRFSTETTSPNRYNKHVPLSGKKMWQAHGCHPGHIRESFWALLHHCPADKKSCRRWE